MKIKTSITIGIPSYQRPNDLDYLLSTIKSLNQYPEKIIIADDNSPDQNKITQIIHRYIPFFEENGVEICYIKNHINLGYDKNLKNIINNTHSDYLMFIGNDDAVDPDCISEFIKFERKFKFNAYSRSFWRFNNNLDTKFGKSWFHKSNYAFTPHNSTPNFYYRLGAYFGGLIFKTEWAKSKEISKFDGTLYYQIYLTASAFYEGGIGYISYPIVGARIEGVPLFGNSESEASDHSPGQYAAKARSAMWKSIISISEYIDMIYSVKSRSFIIKELKTRMSFHLFESYSNRSLSELIELCKELNKLKLFFHPIPILLFLFVLIFRSKSIYLFTFIRKIYQR